MALQITQKSGDGLSRVYGVTVPMQDLADKLEAKIAELQPRMNIKGFRPGKVPAAHVKRMYGKSLMSEIVQQALNDSQKTALDEAKVRVAASPDLKLDETDIERVLAGKADLAYDLSVQVMPDFEPMDVSTITLKRPVHEVSEEEIEEQLKTIAQSNRSYEDRPDGEPAEDGDMVVADFVGRIEGEAFEGGSAEASEIVIGSGRFIPGFEEQLKGAKAGETVTVKVTFPEDYNAEALRGKAAEFETTLKAVRAAQADDAAFDDAFAKRVGFDTLEALKEAVRNQSGQQYAAASRFKAKRALLDVLDESHAFDLPPGMVENEFAAIWAQVEQERASGELSDEDKDKPEDQLRAEYRKIAERRVRLGLVLAEIGQRFNVQVSDQEMQQALYAEIRRYPREQQQQAFEFFRDNPAASAQLRAPIYEEKVVDLILDRAQVEDTPVSKDELFAEDEMPEGYGG